MQQQIISLSDYDIWRKVDFIQQPAMTSSVVGLGRSSKHFPKPNCAQKRSWSLFGGLLPIWPTTAFWIPVKLLYLRGMLIKLMRCTKNCNTCSWNWSTERVQFFFMTCMCMSHNQSFKSSVNWAMKFYLISHIHLTSHQLTTTSSSILTTFFFLARKMLPQPAGHRKCFPRVHQILKHGFFFFFFLLQDM